ncbi:MAG: glycosyltransferase family 2 protein [Thomasclavelia sp.]|nr:glycosyltransferase family 2 protein [Thomasclavelia sp.]
MDNPLISIIIPVYNDEKYLKNTIVSITNQTYANIEIIVIDDGSIDNSLQLLRELANKDQRIKIIHQENKGVSAARNIGIKESQGKYIMFVDGDDILDKKIVSLLFQTLIESNADIAMCDILHIFNTDEFQFEYTGHREIYTGFEFTENMWYQNKFIPSVCAKIYKKNLFNNCLFDESTIYEDVDILYRVFKQINKAVYLDDKLYGYVHHEKSITTNKFSTKDTQILNVCKKLYNFALENKELLPAAKSYYVACALRVYLNAPTKGYEKAVEEAQLIINTFGKEVLHDNKVRKKNRYSIRLYFISKTLLRIVYKRINRWK